MMISNAHTHTLFCDGHNTPREMIESARSKGFRSLGFSGHSPLPFDDDYAIKAHDIPRYNAEIAGLQKEYADKIEVINGIEWDLDTPPVIENLFDISEYEYAISAVHQLREAGKFYSVDDTKEELQTCIGDLFMGDAFAMLEEFFSRVHSAALREQSDIVAHFDLVAKLNGGNVLFDESSAVYRQMGMDAIKRIKAERPELIFEINTGGVYRKNRDYFYPRIDFLERIVESGFRIMINTDSHDVGSIDFGYRDALRLARDAGARSIYVLRRSAEQPAFTGIENCAFSGAPETDSLLPSGKFTARLEKIQI